MRRAARITHDEVTRMVKAVRDLGLPIGRVVFDGNSVSVVIGGDSGEIAAPPLDGPAKDPSELYKPEVDLGIRGEGDIAGDVWRAMVDAALSEPQP